jgi:hypothetical protein
MERIYTLGTHLLGNVLLLLLTPTEMEKFIYCFLLIAGLPDAR